MVYWKVKVYRVALYLLNILGKGDNCLHISVPQVGSGFKPPSPLVCTTLKKPKQNLRRAGPSSSAELCVLRGMGASESTEANSSMCISATVYHHRQQFSLLYCKAYHQRWKNYLVGLLDAADSRGRVRCVYTETCGLWGRCLQVPNQLSIFPLVLQLYSFNSLQHPLPKFSS